MTPPPPIYVTIPLPPSWNQRHGPRKDIEDAARTALYWQKLPREWCYEVFIHCHSPTWFRSARKPWRRDVINYAKVSEDAVTRALGLDDSYTFRLITDKRHSAESFVRVIVRALSWGQDGFPMLPPEGV